VGTPFVKALYKILGLIIVTPILLGTMIFVSSLVLLVGIIGALTTD
jgi:hypothetical protein